MLACKIFSARLSTKNRRVVLQYSWFYLLFLFHLDFVAACSVDLRYPHSAYCLDFVSGLMASACLRRFWLLHVCFMRELLQSPPSDTHADWSPRRRVVVLARLNWSAIWSDSGLNTPSSSKELSCTVSHMLSLLVRRGNNRKWEAWLTLRDSISSAAFTVFLCNSPRPTMVLWDFHWLFCFGQEDDAVWQ